MNALRVDCLLGCVVLLVTVTKSTSGQIISPAQPDVWPGGRAVAVTGHPANSSIAVVAAESGGLFKTTDAGATWTHLDGLVPFRIIDVKYSLVSSQNLIVTAPQNGRINRGGGIWRSTNGGRNWQKPVTGEPPPSAQCSPPVNAYGISVAIGRVFVGTDCGVAVSRDSGATWTHVTPAPAGSSQRTFAVLAQPNDTVVACGDSGVFVSTTNGTSWGAALPGIGKCTQSGPHLLASSPIESNVLFVTTSPSTLMESDDGGQTWNTLNPPPPTGGRPSFVETHLSSDGDPTHFDIYFGNAYNVVRQTCTSGGSGMRCLGPWTNVTVGPNETPHDPNDIAYGSSGNSPRFLLSDSGIYITSDGGLTFTVTGGGRAGYNALQIYDVAGQIHSDHTDVYFGTMDNCLWASANDARTWMNPRCEEGFNLQMKRRPTSHDDQIIVGNIPTRGNFWTSPHFVDYNNWNNPPNGIGNPFIVDTSVYLQYTTLPNSSGNGLALTVNKGMNWNQITQPNSTIPFRIAGGLQHWPQVSSSVTNPVIYQAVSRPGGRIGLVRIDVDISTKTATLADADVNGLGSLGSYCMGQATFVCPVVWGMDTNDPSHLIATDVQSGQMKVSRNSGRDWTVDTSLTELVTDAGQIPFSAGPGVEVHAIGFDPDTSGRILVGTEAAGIFHSTDNGQTWSKIAHSDFFIRGMTSFFFDTGGSVLVSTYGRGLWRIDPGSFPPPTLCGRTRLDCRIDIRDLAGDFIHLVKKNPCPRPPDPPTCQFVDVDRGVIRDFGVDRSGKLNRIGITGADLRAYDQDGKRIPVDINVPFSRPARRNEFSGCEACRNIVSEGRTITGFIHSKGKVLGIISQYRGPADKKPTISKDKFEHSPEAALQLVGSLPITGHAAALNGDSMQVFGTGFCSKAPCPNVTLRVNNRVVANNVKVNSRGEFQAKFVVSELPGRYRVTATSSSSGTLQRRGAAWFTVPTADRGER